MKESDLLYIIASKAYTIAYAANLNFATYDIVKKFPVTVAFISTAVGIIGLVWPDFIPQIMSVIILIAGIASIYIEKFDENIDEYAKRGKENTDQFNQLKILYHQVKGMKEDDDFAEQEKLFSKIEKDFNDGSQPKQIIGANWFAHYKLFFEKDVSWMDEELKFGFWKDKVPQSLKAMLYMAIIAIAIYYCWAVPAINNFFKMILFID